MKLYWVEKFRELLQTTDNPQDIVDQFMSFGEQEELETQERFDKDNIDMDNV